MKSEALLEYLYDYERVRPFLLDPDSPPIYENLAQTVKKISQELADGKIQHPPEVVRQFIQSARRLIELDDTFLHLLHGYWKNDPIAIEAMKRYLESSQANVQVKELGPLVTQVTYLEPRPRQVSSPGYSAENPLSKKNYPGFLFCVAMFLFFLWLWLSASPSWWNR
jgi:hypothetical protein